MAGTPALVDLDAGIAVRGHAKALEVAAALVEAAPGRA